MHACMDKDDLVGENRMHARMSTTQSARNCTSVASRKTGSCHDTVRQSGKSGEKESRLAKVGTPARIAAGYTVSSCANTSLVMVRTISNVMTLVGWHFLPRIFRCRYSRNRTAKMLNQGPGE